MSADGSRDHLYTPVLYTGVCVCTRITVRFFLQIFKSNTNLFLHISRFFFLAILTHRPVLSMWKTINICPW